MVYHLANRVRSALRTARRRRRLRCATCCVGVGLALAPSLLSAAAVGSFAPAAAVGSFAPAAAVGSFAPAAAVGSFAPAAAVRPSLTAAETVEVRRARSPLARQEVSVRAYLSPGATVGLGRTFTLNVEIQGTQTVDEDPSLPDLTAFAQYLGSGSSTSMRMAGGRTEVTLTLQYRFQAVTEGTFTIPPFVVAAGGRKFTTEALEVTVTQAPPPETPGDPAAPSLGPEDLFVTVDASRTSVLVGEPFTVEYRIWTRVDVGSYNLTRVPEFEGFWVEEPAPVEQPRVEQVMRGGQQYATAVIRRITLVPTGPGRKVLAPLGLEAQVRVRTRTRDPFESLFGGGGLLGTTVVPTTVLSDSLVVEVRSLPEDRPELFSGIVGTLDLSASLDRDSVAAGDAVTLTVRASARGNIRGIPAPDLALPSDFDAFPPEVSERVEAAGDGLVGNKTFTFVLIPRAPGERTLPALRMSYFDPDANVFRVASTDPLTLTVTGGASEAPSGAARGSVTQLREDIRFIHLGSGSLRRANRTLFGSFWTWLVLLLPVAGFGGAWIFQRHRARMAGDVAWARSRRAGRVARKRLKAARELAVGEDPRAFYAEVARALRGFVADRLNEPEAGLQNAELARRLRAEGVTEEVVAELRSMLEECDRQRFAPPAGDRAQRTDFVDRGVELMTKIEREVGR